MVHQSDLTTKNVKMNKNKEIKSLRSPILSTTYAILSIYSKLLVQLMRKFGVPESVANAAQCRSNKSKGSSGYYDAYTPLGALKLALIGHCPPLNTAIDISTDDIPTNISRCPSSRSSSQECSFLFRRHCRRC
jgi:hypothetical protein